MRPLLAAAAVTVLLTACQTMPPEPPRATAQLQPTKGNKTFGEATFEQAGDKVRVTVFVQGLKPGQEHALHIHEVGDCSSGDGMSTKDHFNPFGKPHAITGARSATPVTCRPSRRTRPAAPRSTSSSA